MKRTDDHFDGGLLADSATLRPAPIERRRALLWIGGVGAAGLVAGCAGGDQSGAGAAGSSSSSTGPSSTSSSSSTASTSTTAAAGGSAGTPIPEETQGPFPADGSNGPNLLADGAVVRSDITSSIGELSGTADGVPLTLQLTVVDAQSGSPLPGAALYAWHCTADGRYSIYEVEDQNYLRGVQAADDAGKVTFTTVFPGCYNGRWPHVHFEVYEDLAEADAGSNAVRTSQLAFPESDSATVYADARYGPSAGNLSRQSLDSDMVFSDGWSEQLATVSGSLDEGYTASLLVRV